MLPAKTDIPERNCQDEEPISKKEERIRNTTNCSPNCLQAKRNKLDCTFEHQIKNPIKKL